MLCNRWWRSMFEECQPSVATNVKPLLFYSPRSSRAGRAAPVSDDSPVLSTGNISSASPRRSPGRASSFVAAYSLARTDDQFDFSFRSFSRVGHQLDQQRATSIRGEVHRHPQRSLRGNSKSFSRELSPRIVSERSERCHFCLFTFQVTELMI